MTLTREIVERIIAHGRAEAPREACGYIAGLAGSAKLLIPMRNVAASPDRYAFDPAEQFAALRKARAEGLDLVAVYHSHPVTPARMSEEDVKLANDTGVVYLVYSLADGELRAFRVSRDRVVSEENVEVAAARPGESATPI